MTEAYKYKAFISYSHRDRAHADKLFRALESYRVPRRLVGMCSDKGDTIHTRVGHLFRDRDELPAAEDLNAEVKKALTQSEFMIVLCSPAAAASRWVNREIIEFKKLTGERRILSVILSGEPFASDHGRPENECFPPALRYKLSEGGTITQERAEPLAADLRPEGDGERRGLLKLVAGLMGIGLDALIERDLQRKMRRVMAVTAASVTAMLGMGLLTYEAVTARQEAERHRGEAEGLIEFMLTDLRDKLIGVGRLDVMTDVNERAMDYYKAKGDLSTLPIESLDRRARILHAWGEDDENRGNWQQAREKYEEFHRTAQALWLQDPDNPKRVIAYARSINRLALTDHSSRELSRALEQFDKARNKLDSIAIADQNSGEFLQLSALVHGNMCATHLEISEQPETALPHCRAAVEQSDRVTTMAPANLKLRYEYIFHVGWLAEGMAAVGDIEAADTNLRRAISLSEALVAEDADNTRWREQQMEIYARFAKFSARQDRDELARAYLAKARAISRLLVQTDPTNSFWSEYEKKLQSLIKQEADRGTQH